ncbi:MFS transporter [uncultured Mucilaginibacter sp.]|uniref:MFS transporter n=1 Tax=uncultured Mucilaginibacter sp. TaxID=797541 RepID=UPI00261DF787|nr:MFS transporter [uncultured Mucilaginibacter sp.]
MEPKSQETKTPYRFMLPLVLGTMMNPLNSTMLATALITLCNSFKISVGSGAVLIVSLYVTSTIAQPLMGRLADIYSAKKINTAGFILVLIAALIGMFAPSFGWLIVSRIILGLGTSAAYPSAIALLNKKYAEINKPVPGNVLGIVAITSQVSGVLGPTLGGLLTEAFGWQGIFFINIPWVIVALYLSRAIPDYPAFKSNTKVSLFKKLDIPGILIFSLFLLSLLYVLLQPVFLWYPVAAVVLLLIFVIWWEWKQESPFIDIKLLYYQPALFLVYVRTLATNYILYMILFALPQWLEGVRHVMPAKTGITLLPMTGMAILVGYGVSKIEKPVFQNVLGVAVMLVACLSLFLVNASIPLLFFVLITMVIGVADGINMIANQALLNREVPMSKKGVSFGLYRTAGYIGAILSGTQLKKLFHFGVTDQSFHRIGFYTLIAALVLLVLLVPLLFKVNKPYSKLVVT